MPDDPAIEGLAKGVCLRLDTPHSKDMHAGIDSRCDGWRLVVDRMQFDGSMKSYDDIWRWMRDVGNTHQQAGEVIFCGGNPTTMRWPSMPSYEQARPGDWVVMHSQHDFRVERSEAIALRVALAALERAERVIEAAKRLRALHVKRDQMIDNDTWETEGVVPTYTAIVNAEAKLSAALSDIGEA